MKVNPICLPAPYEESTGVEAFAAGWGRFASPEVSTAQSKNLLFTKLRVSNQVYKHYFMFGTYLMKNSNGQYKDPCSGDSGIFLINGNTKDFYIILCRWSPDVF